MGAGSAAANRKKRTVSSIAQNSLSTAKQNRLLWRLCKHLHCKHVLELGTSLGISAAYLSSAAEQIYTIEGAESIRQIAQENWSLLDCQNINSFQGDFDQTLAEVIAAMPRIDFAFIDGNHQLKPTLAYFEQILAAAHDETVIVFDDIHWSEEMEQAWREICAHEEVRVSIDLFWCGIVFLRPGLSKEHFTIRY